MLRKNIWKLLFHSQDLLRWIINRSCRWTTLSNNKVCLHFILSSNPWNSKSRKDNSALPQLSSSVFGEYSSWLKIAANWRWLFPSYFCSSFKTEEAFQHLVCVCVCVHIYTYMWSEVKWKWLSCILLFAFPWTETRQASLSMEFPRQKYWSGLLFPSPGELPDPGIEPGSPSLQADSLPSEPQGKPHLNVYIYLM